MKLTLQDETLKQEFAKMNLILSATNDIFTVTAQDGTVAFTSSSLSELTKFFQTTQKMWERNR